MCRRTVSGKGRGQGKGQGHGAQEGGPGGKGLLVYTIKTTKSDNYLVHFIFVSIIVIISLYVRRRSDG